MGAATTMASDSLLQEISRERGTTIQFLNKYDRFQSTHPRGVRQVADKKAAINVIVSIHAPAWGATPHNHYSILYQEFQSTHPRGVRLLININ